MNEINNNKLNIPDVCKKITISNIPNWVLKYKEFRDNLAVLFNGKIDEENKYSIIINRNGLIPLSDKAKNFIHLYSKFNKNYKILINNIEI